MNVRNTLPACILALVTGCALWPLPERLASRAPIASGSSADAPDATVVSAGATLTLHITWPARTSQLLPASATTLVLTLRDAANAVIKTQNVIRPESTAAFDNLPSGTITISAVALDSTLNTVATGTTTATLVANVRNKASLVMTPSKLPVITDFSPKAGGPGTWVTVTGSGFPLTSDNVTATASFGGAGVAFVGIQRSTSPNEIFLKVPDLATTSIIVITEDGLTARSQATFATVGTLEIAPLSPTPIASGGTIPFVITARAASASTAVPGALLSLSLTHVVAGSTGGDPGGSGDRPYRISAVGALGTLGTLSATSGTTDASGQVSSVFTASATGSAWLQVTCGPVLLATTSIAVE